MTGTPFASRHLVPLTLRINAVGRDEAGSRLVDGAARAAGRRCGPALLQWSPPRSRSPPACPSPWRLPARSRTSRAGCSLSRPKSCTTPRACCPDSASCKRVRRERACRRKRCCEYQQRAAASVKPSLPSCASPFMSGCWRTLRGTAGCVIDRHQFDPPFAERRPVRLPRRRGAEIPRGRGRRPPCGSRRAPRAIARTRSGLLALLVTAHREDDALEGLEHGCNRPAIRLQPSWDRRVHRGRPVLVSNGTRRPRMDFRILGPLEVHDQKRPRSAGASNAPCSRCCCCTPTRPSWSSGSSTSSGLTPHPERDEERPSPRPRLRRTLGEPSAPNGDARSNGVVLTRAHGYVLTVAPGELDLDRFESLLEAGRGALAAGRAGEASATLRKALAVWRGPPLEEFASDSCPRRHREAERAAVGRRGPARGRSRVRRSSELVPSWNPWSRRTRYASGCGAS